MVSIPLVFSIVFSFICLISCFLGIYTFYSNPKSTTNRLFFALSISLFIWSFGFAFAISAPDKNVCLFWRRFSAIGWGLFYGILLHFIVSLTNKVTLLNKWWKYALLYLPTIICISVFTYIPGINPNQFNLIQTPFGWVNVSIKNMWDWYFIIYYVSYTTVGLFLLWRWGKHENSKNTNKQSKIVLRSFIATLVAGIFFESVVNNVFSIKIPQIAPIIMVLPILSISYAMQKYGLLETKRNFVDSLMFVGQIRMKIVHYLANTLFAASILNIITTYFMFEEKNIVSTLLYSGFLIALGIVFEIIQRINKSTRYKDFLYAAIFFLMIPLLTLRFIEYASVTAWAISFVFLIISIAMVSRIIQIAVAVSIILTQLVVFLLKPSVSLIVGEVDHVGRIGFSVMAIWIALFVMNVFKSKLNENAYQISFQKLVVDISQHYVSAGESGFDEVTNDTLIRINEFLKTDGIHIYMLNDERDAVVNSYSWMNGQNSIEDSRREINLDDYSTLLKRFTEDNTLEIFDTDDLLPQEQKELEKFMGGQVKSILVLPIENNNNVYGYLRLQSSAERKTWSTVDKNNLTIITNIIAETIERIRQEQQINFMAYYDVMTKLPNRTLFKDRLSQAISLAKRTSRIIAVMFIDLDSFKYVNDTIGHDGGDELILRVSQKLSASLRKSDSVSRFGGDEFLVMANYINNTEDIYKIADKIMAIFKAPFCVMGQEIHVSVSAGIAVYPYDGEDADTLIRNADIAMYQAKAKTKGHYCLCTEGMKEEVRLKHELSNRLYRAVDNGELFLHYQPLVSAQTGEILSVEALVRWNQPEFGLVNPGVFIPLAEQNGLIGVIGEWVLKTACIQTKKWKDMGFEKTRIAVNVSILQLRNPKFVGIIKGILQEAGIEPWRLDLEITEGSTVRESESIINILAELKELGVGISIDDFGTEYSSLSRLNRLPANRIKIDRSFINNLFRSEKDQAIVSGMITLAHTLGVKVVAEGVEQETQLEFLTLQNCDEIQGYFICRPVSADDISALLNGENVDRT